MLNINKFNQLITHLFLSLTVIMVYATYMPIIYIRVELKLSKGYNNCISDVSPSVIMFILILFRYLLFNIIMFLYMICWSHILDE